MAENNKFHRQRNTRQSRELADTNKAVPQAEAPDASAEESAKAPVEVVGISFREAGKIYYFAPNGLSFSQGDKVIVETARGVEMGTVKIANKLIPEKEVVQPLKSVTRLATPEDIECDIKNHEMELDAAVICKKKIEAHKLEMSLVAVEYTFDNSKLIFYFTAESRVDFRELVKDLASTFHTRIELRQIGIRDEAKMMGGLAVCGRKYCCAGFLTDFVQVSIKMAKEQSLSLNSAKVSGACGRLLCCLRYEHDVYEEAIRNTPPVGSVVKTADGEGVIIDTKPLAGEVRVKIGNDDKEVQKVFKCKDVKVLKYGARFTQNDEIDEDVPTD